MSEPLELEPTKLDLSIESYPDLLRSTRIHGDAKSVCFETTDKDGQEYDPSFELTWEEIFKACREYAQR